MKHPIRASLTGTAVGLAKMLLRRCPRFSKWRKKIQLEKSLQIIQWYFEKTACASLWLALCSLGKEAMRTRDVDRAVCSGRIWEVKGIRSGFPSRWWISSPTPVDTKDRWNFGLLRCRNQVRPFFSMFSHNNILLFHENWLESAANIAKLPSTHVVAHAWQSWSAINIKVRKIIIFLAITGLIVSS